MRRNIFEHSKPREMHEGKDNVFAQFLQEKGIYDSMKINEDNISDLIDLLAGSVRISMYCKECRAERVFSMLPYIYIKDIEGDCVPCKLSEEIEGLQNIINLHKTPAPDKMITGGDETQWEWRNWQIEEDTRIMVFKYVCSMNESHHLDFVVLTDKNSFKKIGQYPSVADLSFSKRDDYNKVMSDLDRKEMGRAIGLYASGIGVGSFVYLRRILERLLTQAKENAGDTIDDKEYNSARMAQKISLLKDYLPPILVSNSKIYGILSKGIHELKEEECLEYFPVIQECIYMTLNQWESIRRTKAMEKEINTALSKIASEIQ